MDPSCWIIGIVMFFFPLLLGYTVTSVVSARSGQLYVAGAPRFNHTGKVIVFTLKNTGELTILHSLKGHQVKVWLTHIQCTFTCIFYTHWISSSSKDFALINYLACTHCLSSHVLLLDVWANFGCF